MEKIKEKIKKITLNQWHIVLIVLGIIFIGLGAFHNNVWFDESYSVAMANHSFGEIWSIGGHDVHPVLYYWALRIVCLLTGGSIIAYRLFSAIPIAIMIILGYTHIRKDFGEKTGLIFSFLAAFLPEMATYAIEVRMYSWAILTVTLLAIYAYRLSKEDKTKHWIIFGISSIASIHLHYYGLMAAGLINVALLVYLIIKKRKTGLIFIISFGIVQALSYLPWLMFLATQMKQVSGGFWISLEFPKAPMELLSSQLAGYIRTGDYRELLVPTVLAIELYAYMIYKTYKLHKEKQDIKPILWSSGMYLAVILAAWIMTKILGTAILYYRYLFVITGLYVFAISYILNKEKSNVAIVSILVVIAGLGIYNNIGMIKDNYSSSNAKPLNYLEENIKEDDTIVFVDNALGSGSVVTVNFKDNKTYFYNSQNWGVEEAYRAFGPNYETVVTKDFIENCNDRIWIIEDVSGSSVNDVIEDTEYKVVSEEQFFTEYHGYTYKITLVEK